ncbi:hypothetical protein LINPERHAP1_LOCUS38836 [Linum perenne]
MTISSSISRVVVGVNRFTFLSYLVFSLPSLALLKSPWCPGFFSVLAGLCWDEGQWYSLRLLRFSVLVSY